MKKEHRLGLYPGTFDPVTYGHLDLLQRATSMFDEVVVAISENSSKKTLFSITERKEMLEQAIAGLTFRCDIRVETFKGLLFSYARDKGAHVLVRGLRAISDFEYEFQMALMNRNLSRDIETVFLMPDEKYIYLSSSIVKEVGRLGGDLNLFVPTHVGKALQKKIQNL